MKIRTLALSLAVSLLAVILVPSPSLAGTAVLYVSPASGTVPVGNIIPVQIRVNSGSDPVNAIQANLSYNPAQLAYQSVSSTGSAFSLVANTQTASGSVKLARGAGGGEAPVSGDKLFATVLFKALTTTGTASVAIAADSHVVRSTDSVDILVGAPTASGPKASAAGATTPKSYTSLAAAQASIVTGSTPTPTTAAYGSQSTKATATPAASGKTAATSDMQKLAWNSPYILGGAALLLLVLVAVILAYWKSRRALSGPVAPALVNPAPVQPTTVSPSAPASATIINPTPPVQPEVETETKSDSDQLEG